VMKEVALLKRLGEASVVSTCLPPLLCRFQSAVSIFWLFKGQVACDLGVLVDHGKVAEQHLRLVGACVVEALDFLQREIRALYRNLVPENLYLMDSGYVALLDFKFAKHDEAFSRTLCGAPAYMAPEQVRGEVQTFATDWWGLGVLLFELCCGESPWGAADADDMSIFKRISSHQTGSLPLPETCSPELGELVEALLHPVADRRLGSASQEGGRMVKDHVWFSDINWEQLAAGDVVSPLLDFAREQLEQRAAGPENAVEHSPASAALDQQVEQNASWLDGF